MRSPHVNHCSAFLPGCSCNEGLQGVLSVCCCRGSSCLCKKIVGSRFKGICQAAATRPPGCVTDVSGCRGVTIAQRADSCRACRWLQLLFRRQVTGGGVMVCKWLQCTHNS